MPILGDMAHVRNLWYSAGMSLRTSWDAVKKGVLRQYLQTHRWKAWVKGLVSAGITGSASAIVTGGVVKIFDLQMPIKHQVILALTAFLQGGGAGVCNFLLKSPLPDRGKDTGDLLTTSDIEKSEEVTHAD